MEHSRQARLSVALCASTLLYVAGCGEGGERTVPLSSIGHEMAEAACGKMAECCTPEELAGEALGADTSAECVALFGGLLSELLVPVLEDSVAAGRLVYHGEEMGACLAAIAEISCAEYQSMRGGGAGLGCVDPFEGQVAPGGECATDMDCVSGYCSGESVDFEGNVTMGTCDTAPGVGDPCDGGDCADGTFCDYASPDGPTCQAALADGSACDSDDQCASGACDETCGEPTTCDGT